MAQIKRIVVSESAISGNAPIRYASAHDLQFHPVARGGHVYRQADDDFWKLRIEKEIVANRGRCGNRKGHLFRLSSVTIAKVIGRHAEGTPHTLALSSKCSECGSSIVTIWELDPQGFIGTGAYQQRELANGADLANDA
jgi:hypothetical protein